MSIRTEPLIGVTRARPRRRPASLAAWLDREPVFSWLMMTAPILFLAAFVGYPFVYGILLSLQDRPVAHVGTFVGLKNFVRDFNDPIFWRVAINTFVYTGVATLDGASGWQRFRYVTLPLLQPIILIVTLFSVIFTFADFQLVYVLTHGGPQNATQLFATYAFDIGMGAGQLGLGASVALTMLPALALLILALTLYMRRQ